MSAPSSVPTAAASTVGDVRFDSLSAASVRYAFDFLPLLQHLLKQTQHNSGTSATQAADAKAVQAATDAVVRKIATARSLLQYLPNIDVSQQEQMQESARLDQIIDRKRALIQALNITTTATTVEQSTKEEEKKEEGVKMEM